MNTENKIRLEHSSPFLTRDKCPACDSKRDKILCSVGYTDLEMRNYLEAFYSAQGEVDFKFLAKGRYILVECLDCGLVYQKEIPNDFLMFKLYEEWINPGIVYEKVEEKRSTRYYLKIVKEVANLASFFNANPADLKILDYGMGWGNWARVAKGFGCDVYGIELSKVRIDYAQSAGIKVIAWDKLRNYRFDFINANQVFEHISDPLDSLQQLKRSLKERGVIKISVPNGTDIKRRLKIWNWSLPREHRNSLNPVAPLEHINCFNYEVLINLAGKAKLEPVPIPDKYPTLLLKEKVIDVIRPFYYLLMSARFMKHTNIYFIKSG